MNKYESNQHHLPVYNFQDVINTDPELIGSLASIDIERDVAVLPFSRFEL
jgi:hypothetical protein